MSKEEPQRINNAVFSHPTPVSVEGKKAIDYVIGEINGLKIMYVDDAQFLIDSLTPVSVELSDMQYVSEVITEADDLLVQIENIAHNEIGDWVTDARGKIQDGLKYIRSLTPYPEQSELDEAIAKAKSTGKAQSVNVGGASITVHFPPIDKPEPSGKECKHDWICPCGRWVDINDASCPNCDSDVEIPVSPPKTEGDREFNEEEAKGYRQFIDESFESVTSKAVIKALEEVMEEIEKTPTSFGYGSGDSGILKNIISETIRSKITQLQSESKAEGEV